MWHKGASAGNKLAMLSSTHTHFYNNLIIFMSFIRGEGEGEGLQAGVKRHWPAPLQNAFKPK